MVFDGARAFDGVMPDIELHCARVNESAANMLLEPLVGLDQWLSLVHEGVKRFDHKAELYIRPMYWAEDGVGGGVRFDPSSTNWCLTIYEAPMPEPNGCAVTLSPYRRPTADTAPVNAKASSLYANGSRALIEAYARGFDNCLMRDMLGNIAEFANSNAFLVKDRIVYTPFPNGTFLDGISRRRVIGLLRDAGTTVVETTLIYADFQNADEIFSTGNFQKVAPVTRIEDRDLPQGPIYKRARTLYWEFAHNAPRISPDAQIALRVGRSISGLLPSTSLQPN
jgi:branched-chain amino acid aminotransferase